MAPKTEGVNCKVTTIPGWCRVLMEISLWAAITTGVFLVKPLGLETTRAVCAAFVGVLTAMWLLHWLHMHWLPVAFSFSGIAGIALLAYLLFFRGNEFEGNALTALICLPVFFAIPGAFTEKQVSRFLAFLCAAGAIQVLFCLFAPTLIEEKESLRRNLWESRKIIGTLSSEAELTAFLACTACASAAFAFWAISRMVPEVNTAAPGWRANILATFEINMALLGLFSFILALVPLYFCHSLFPLTTFVLLGICLLIFLAARRCLSWKLAIPAIALLLLVCTADLSRPAPAGERISMEVLESNLHNIAKGKGQRVQVHAMDPKETTTVGPATDAAPASSESEWVRLLEKSDWGSAFHRLGRIGFILLAVFYALLLIEGFKAFFTLKDIHPVLLAGALAGLLGLGLIGLWGRFTANPGLALLAAAFCAMTAARGEYDEEFEEVKILS